MIACCYVDAGGESPVAGAGEKTQLLEPCPLVRPRA